MHLSLEQTSQLQFFFTNVNHIILKILFESLDFHRLWYYYNVNRVIYRLGYIPGSSHLHPLSCLLPTD